MEIISSEKQTKTWRKNQSWYKSGKSNECEKYQLNLIEKITKMDITKCNKRIHYGNLLLEAKRAPLCEVDGFEWSEDFDGCQIINTKTHYYNLKFVCDRGGAQTRSLREVYHFIIHQIKYIKKHKSKDILFINILDGDESNRHMLKYKHLLQLKKYSKYTSQIFIGDMLTFQGWVASK